MIVGVFVIFGGLSATLFHRLNHFKSKRVLTLDQNVAAAFKELQNRLGINIFLIVSSLFFASGVLIALEGWTFPKALYFAVQTATVSSKTVDE
jgi:hypothetical protein